MLTPAAQKTLTEWQSKKFDKETRDDIRQLIKHGDAAIEDAFGRSLSFGTAGIRGLMGAGPNRLNRYTIAAATEGVARYLEKIHKNPKHPIRVLIGYDSRRNSSRFAEVTAQVFASHGFEVVLFAQMRPTPWVSFGVRHLHCAAGIMITASHNPSSYNGYKVFGPDGGQVLPAVDQEIMAEIRGIIDPTSVSLAPLDSPNILMLQGELDDEYVTAIYPLQNFHDVNKEAGSSLYVIYSSLHGTGITVIDRVLASWGFYRLSYVTSQIIPDGNFPTAPYPNPESPEAMQLGLEQLQYEQGDILIVNDPDADRIGVACFANGTTYSFTGNQMLAIWLYYLCSIKRDLEILPPHSEGIKTIVSTGLFKAIGDSFGVNCIEVLTGFKYIGHQITLWAKEKDHIHHFLMGGEESYGALYGTHARDKDGIVMAALTCEIALYLKQQEMTLLDYWDYIQHKYGVFTNISDNLPFSETGSGHKAMAAAMERLRKNPPATIGSHKVTAIRDYLQTPDSTSSLYGDALQYTLEKGASLIVRPSGTEPKVKIYVETQQPPGKALVKAREASQAQAKALLNAMKELLAAR